MLPPKKPNRARARKPDGQEDRFRSHEDGLIEQHESEEGGARTGRYNLQIPGRPYPYDGLQTTDRESYLRPGDTARGGFIQEDPSLPFIVGRNLGAHPAPRPGRPMGGHNGPTFANRNKGKKKTLNWPTVAQGPNRLFAPGEIGPANLNFLQKLQPWANDQEIFYVRTDATGVWTSAANYIVSGKIYRFEPKTDGSGMWENVESKNIEGFGTVPDGPVSGAKWYPGGMFILPKSKSFWVEMGALKIFVANEVAIRVYESVSRELRWEKRWYDLSPTNLQYLGTPISDPIDDGPTVYLLTVTNQVGLIAGPPAKLCLLKMSAATGLVTNRFQLNYDGNDEALLHRSFLRHDMFDGAVNSYEPQLDSTAISGESKQSFKPQTPSELYGDYGTLTVSGFLAVEFGEKLLVIPRVHSAQVRVFDARTEDAAQWAFLPAEPELGPTVDGEMIIRYPIAAVPEIKRAVDPKPPRLVIAWEKFRYQYWAAYSEANTIKSNQIQVWIGLYAMQNGGGYNAANEWAWIDQANYDIISLAPVFSDLRFYAPFSQLPGATPSFFFYSDVELVSDPWATMDEFLEDGQAAPTPPMDILDVTGVMNAPVPTAAYTYTPSAGIGSKMTAVEAGYNLSYEVPGTGGSVWIFQSGDVVVINAQSIAKHNGVYRVTNSGSLTEPWELTRHEDADEGGELFNLWVRENWYGLDNLWFCENTAVVDDDPIFFRPVTEGEGLNPLEQTLFPGDSVDAGQFVVGYRNGMETRDLSDPELPLIGQIDFSAPGKVMEPKIRRQFTRKIKVGVPTYHLKVTEKAAGEVIPIETIRFSPPGGNASKLYADQTIIAIVKHKVFADDLTKPIEGTEIYGPNPAYPESSSEEFIVVGYGDYEDWDGEAYAWVFWAVERNFIGNKGLAPDAYQARYYCYCWEWDTIEATVFDAAPPAWDMTNCCVSLAPNTVLFGPKANYIGLEPGPQRKPPSSFGAQLYTPLPGPDNVYPVPLYCQVVGFDLDSWELKFRTDVGPVIGSDIFIENAGWYGTNMAMTFQPEDKNKDQVAFQAWGETPFGDDRSTIGLVDAETGELRFQLLDVEADVRQSDRFHSGLVAFGKNLFYNCGFDGKTLRRRTEGVPGSGEDPDVGGGDGGGDGGDGGGDGGDGGGDGGGDA